MTPTQAKAEWIAKLVAAAAARFGTTPAMMFNTHKNSMKSMLARQMVMIHLHDCGMPIEQIAKVFNRAVSTVNRSLSCGRIRSFKHLDWLASLPKQPLSVPSAA